MKKEKPKDALKNLVMFIIYLAVLALLACFVIYMMAVAPGQQAAGIAAPMNFLVPI